MNQINMDIPRNLLNDWQDIVNMLAELNHIPAALRHSIESLLISHPEATFTHSICPSCIKKLYPDLG